MKNEPKSMEVTLEYDAEQYISRCDVRETLERLFGESLETLSEQSNGVIVEDFRLGLYPTVTVRFPSHAISRIVPRGDLMPKPAEPPVGCDDGSGATA